MPLLEGAQFPIQALSCTCLCVWRLNTFRLAMSLSANSILRSSLVLPRASTRASAATSQSLFSRHASVAASTPPAAGQGNPFDVAEDEESEAPRRGRPKVSFRSWLETRGEHYREPKAIGPTWLGRMSKGVGIFGERTFSLTKCAHLQ